jgi:hypothetical protein
MAMVMMEIPEKLLAKLRNTGRPIQEVVTEVLERQFSDECEDDGQQAVEPSREALIQQLVATGLIREPGSWDTPGAQAWRAHADNEKQRLVKEMQATYFPDSFASNLISENRR